jgi:hypothetical protein
MMHAASTGHHDLSHAVPEWARCELKAHTAHVVKIVLKTCASQAKHLVDLHVGRLLVDVRPVGRRRVALEHVQQLVAAVAVLEHL